MMKTMVKQEMEGVFLLVAQDARDERDRTERKVWRTVKHAETNLGYIKCPQGQWLPLE